MKQRPSAGPLIESLESRQLLAAVVDLRLAGGGTSVSNVTVGQKIDMQVWVTVTGSDNNVSNDELQIAVGSMLSTNVNGGAAKGDLAVTLLAPFDANGAQNGAQADLDGDGDLDVGSNDSSQLTGLIFARSAQMESSGTPVTKGQSFEIATAQFTVTSLLAGEKTNIVFRPRGTTNGYLYLQDGVSSVVSGSLVAGTSIAINGTPRSTINGRVFNDKNADGVFDGDDTGISGFRVFLDTNNNAILDPGEISKPVSSTGTYHFTAVPPGTYRVREVFRQGWRQSFPALGYYQVTLGIADDAKTQSFANTDTVVIKGRVFMDADKDGILDSAEGGLANWRVFIDKNHNGTYDKKDISAITDANGNYRFFNLPAGSYTVGILQLAGYRQTAPSGGFQKISLAAGGTVSNKNFGEKRLK